MDDARIGTQIGGCRIERSIGRGGMGLVYEAEQLRLGRVVAVKLILPEYALDDEFRRRFEQESRLAASLDHPSIVPIYEAGEHEGLLYIVMRMVAGANLSEAIRSTQGLVPERAARIVEQIAGALDAAHEHGLVHRDVKPANILLEQGSRGEVAYLTDFGLTKLAADSQGLTRTNQWLGTVDYIAPEQMRGGPVDARTDVYALGCVLYQALTGRVPFPRDSDVAKMWAHANDPAPTVSEHAPSPLGALDQVVARALAKDPDDRFSSAGDLGRAAAAAAHGEVVAAADRSVARGDAAPTVVSTEDSTRAAGGSTSATRVASPTALQAARARRPRSARLPLLAGAVVLAALVVAGTILALSGGSGSEQKKPGAPGSATVSMAGGGLSYRAAPGDNHVTIGIAAASGNRVTIQDSQPISPGAGCRRGATADSAVCDPTGGRVDAAEIHLGDGDDSLTYTARAGGAPFQTRVFDGPGNDTLTSDARFGATFVNGPGNDVFGIRSRAGDSGISVVAGQVPGVGYVSGSGDDKITGGAGNDSLVSGIGNDVVRGGEGTDVLNGGAGTDRLFGGPGSDLLLGYFQNDYLDGGPGDDRLFGGTGTDEEIGGGGVDILDGTVRQSHTG